MSGARKPTVRPRNPRFSSGPCAKPPGWTAAGLEHAFVGRSHRAPEGRARLKHVIDETKRILDLPKDYRVAITPGSDSGAFEMAMWSLLGARGVDVLAWEVFGHLWLTDITDHLQLKNVRVLKADYGHLPDLATVNWDHDAVFTANGTTSGVRVPDYNWIPENRKGLTLADATSAVFAQAIDWSKFDCLTFSWQKALGGEAGHGMIILSPRAVERLETVQPPWPLPKLFRLTKGGKIDEAIFEGQTINTPSMLCVEDYAQALAWVDRTGGLPAMIARANANAQLIHDWVARMPWMANLAIDPKTWSNTSVCLKIVDPGIASQPINAQAAFVQSMVQLLEDEGVAFDIRSYRDAPPGLRIWTGPTVEAADIAALLPWLDWAYAETLQGHAKSI